jgi:hypothetical protein
MNKITLYVFVVVLTSAIVLLVVGSVNTTATSNPLSYSAVVASGSPAPPPVPPAFQQPALFASGSPAPPPVPPLAFASFVA